MNTYKIILNKNGTTLEIKADTYYIKDNILYFEIYNDCFITAGVFNINNIIGFYKVYNK